MGLKCFSGECPQCIHFDSGKCTKLGSNGTQIYLEEVWYVVKTDQQVEALDLPSNCPLFTVEYEE